MTRSDTKDQTETTSVSEQQPTMSQLWELVQEQRRDMERQRDEQRDTVSALQARLATLDQRMSRANSAITRPSTVLSRKGLLSAAAAGAAGLVGAGAFLHPDSAAATNGSPVLLGSGNTATALTEIDASSAAGTDAFKADSNGGIAVLGNNTGSNYGIKGQSATGNAIWGRAGAGATGVLGDTVDGNGIGVYGHAGAAGYGVQGLSVSGTGVSGTSTSGFGVSGISSINVGVYGQGTYGGEFSGALANLYLRPGNSIGAPTSQNHNQGEIFLDFLGVPYVNEADGTPGTWQAIGNFRPFPAGHRVFNSSMAPSGLATGISALTDVHGTSTGVPATAIAVYCAVQSYKSGTLTIFPDGASEPTAANWSGTGTTGILNLLYMIVPLSSAGKFSIRSHLVAAGQVYVDVWGYLM